MVDVNKDGRMDLLTTTWSQLGDPGALLAYEIPDNWQDVSAWTESVFVEIFYLFFFNGERFFMQL